MKGNFSTARHWLRYGFNLLLPAQCPACEVFLPPSAKPSLCPSCWQKLPRWDQTIPQPPGLPPRVSSMRAPFLYEEPISSLIQQLKYADQPRLAEILANFLRPLLPTDADLIVPVPLHKNRLHARRYNQSAELAKHLARQSNLALGLKAAARIKNTASQVGQGARTRKRQMAGAFIAEAKLVAGKNIVLLDDVWTTGATAGACATALHKAGASKVDVLTLCYVAP